MYAKMSKTENNQTEKDRGHQGDDFQEPWERRDWISE